MATPRKKVWTIEPHSRAKHELLIHYLNAWYPIIGRSSRRAVFIDGFAGPGIYDDDSPGSPIIALRTLLNHAALPNLGSCTFCFLFIESDPARFEQLEQEVSALGTLPSNVKVQMRNSEFNEVADELASLVTDKNQDLAPTLAFVDPFGISGVPMELIARLLSSDRCELFLTLMVDHLNRFARTGQIDKHCESLFGTDQYRNARGVPALIDLYEKQLRKVAKFTYVHEFEMLRTDGHPAYYLIHATRSPIGVSKMKDAMWRVDPGSGFSFSDRHALQGKLFTGKNVNVGPLRKEMLAKFVGNTVSIEVIQQFVLLETLYHPEKHLKKLTLAPMENEGLIVVANPKSGRRRGTYAKGTQITFVK